MSASGGVAGRACPAPARPGARGAVRGLLGVLLLHPRLGYVLVIDEFGKVVPHDLYKLNLTACRGASWRWIRQNVPPDAKMIIDDDIWADLHDVRPYYKWAHSYSKAARDPDVRDKLFGKDWHNIDYIVLSNQMRTRWTSTTATAARTGFRRTDAATQVWVEERGD